MDGIGWLIKNALAGAGVEIDPKEIATTIDTAKFLIPKIASEFESLRKSTARIELKLDSLIELQKSSQLIATADGIDVQLSGIDDSFRRMEMYQK